MSLKTKAKDDRAVTLASWNVNGIRAIQTKEFGRWFERQGADIICLQETKARPEQFPLELVAPRGYHAYVNSAERKGYSGVAVYSIAKPIAVFTKIGHPRFDTEGRMIHLVYPNFSLVNLYMPNGGRNKEDLAYKLEVYDALFEYLKNHMDEPLILAGDMNIAHTPKDLARPDENEQNTMFTPEERKKLDTLVSIGFTDTFRVFNEESGNYTWWAYWAESRARNIGWRIDYVFASALAREHLSASWIDESMMGSDHCPIFASFTF